jgi:hypothetical protein
MVSQVWVVCPFAAHKVVLLPKGCQRPCRRVAYCLGDSVGSDDR